MAMMTGKDRRTALQAMRVLSSTVEDFDAVV
jgi:hypothetical protein